MNLCVGFGVGDAHLEAGAGAGHFLGSGFSFAGNETNGDPSTR